MKKTTIFIIIDALRWDYMNEKDTPTLWNMSQEGIYAQKLRPSFGFCERSEMFTGTRPDVNGNFTAITYNPLASPYKKYKILFKLFSAIETIPATKKYIRYFLRHLMPKFPWPVYYIPLNLLSQLYLPEDQNSHIEPNAFVVESLFDTLTTNKRTFYYDSFTALTLKNGDDNDRVNLLLSHLKEKKDFYLLYLGNMDIVGHYKGPNSVERHTEMRKIDTKIKNIVKASKQYYDQINFVIIGDHGMVNVINQVDIWSKIKNMEKKNKIKNGKDFVMFLDSTLARFWFKNKNTETEIKKLFEKNFSDYGKIITSEVAKTFHVPLDTRYGEFIWLANPGILIHPDYFHITGTIKGMHGYDPSIDEQKGTAIVWGNGINSRFLEKVALIDICPTLCDLLQIRYPKNNQGKSLIKQ